MRPKMKIPLPERSGSEFENFDRLAGILMRVKPKKKGTAKRKKQHRSKG